MKKLKALLAISITVTLILLLQTRIGEVPPLGKFLNPVSGFWHNAESKTQPAGENLKLPGLLGKVTIRYDENRIPHIFAENDHDLYYGQGYVTARDRLWQMDIQTRSASGRLAEIIGPKALGNDQYQRRIGMVYGAENTLRGMMKEPVIRTMLEAYTQGVNSYVHQLSPKNYPIEFKLMDYAPEDWKPINCAFLLKLMSETLAGGSSQFAMTNTLKHFGAMATNDLFPAEQFHDDPIIPAGTQWNFRPVEIPKPSPSFIAQMTATLKTIQKQEGIGSNNWAIRGSKTSSGYPILANDPHLNLTLPAIWYQVQLAAPGVNVAGVSIPGAPCIIVGYNQQISWGVTNVDADVLDWYQIKFKDVSRNEYWYNNQWNKVTRRIEVIKVRGGSPVNDTVIYTHHGPVVYETTAQKAKGTHNNVPVGNALRWIAHDESDDLLTFYRLNRGKNYEDYREALSHYTAPAQNFVFASNDNDIAITANGKFPVKFKDQGKYILDGSDPANDWHGWIPAEQNPTVKNPERGFVSSANQTATDKTYPYYLNWDFGNYDRGKRINMLLSQIKQASVDNIRVMQSDNYSTRAEDVLPAMLKYLDPSRMDDLQKSAYELLKNWDKRFDVNAMGATIFSNWWDKFYQLTWNDEYQDSKTLLKYPSFDRTEKLLLKEPNSHWFDNTLTPGKENCEDILRRSFNLTVAKLNSKLGRPGKNWEWGMVKITHIDHLASLTGFGTGNFSIGGTNDVINALKNGSGPSWRMVVQMGPRVKGYGVFPGGESGNPGSFYYDDMFKTWRDGKLNELLFLQSPTENSARIKSTLTLSAK
ncbi:penicillin acylase family protein [Mucilaginibacter sp. UYCu711]|uniref:penicillin acylase family protein n=1 Tax=Mucilaginibacter sp. UYCu711 TaxID=3156339 RepID=UPI003D1D2528